jgi:hypothetical protein
VLAAALGSGLAVGTVLAATGTLDVTSDSAPLAAYDEASYFDCPGGAPLDVFVRGDRVFLTGRDASGGWVEVRDPFAASGRVWMRAVHVTPDAVVDLPVVSCELPIETTTTTTTATTETTGTTASPDTTGTTGTTGTTAALPSVGTISASVDPIWEGYTADEGPGTCTSLPGQPIKSVIAAAVFAPAGVQGVVMEWSVGGVSGSASMTESGGSYRATLGRFDAESPNVVPQGGTATITVTVRVTDALGRVATGGRTVTLKDCTFG